jgi:thiosulfate dehydrogenase [quinone] large subunit
MSSLRTVIYALGAVAAVSLALLVFSFFNLTGDIRTLVTWVFWISFIALLVTLYIGYRNTPGSDDVQVEGPGFARFLFNNRAAGLFWLPIRLFVGVSFLDAGLHKLTDPAWTQGGSALLGYWQHAVAIPDAPARPAITYDWYRDFLQALINMHAEPWFAWLVTLGELAVGLGLIFGVLTGIAAFFGAFLNMSFLLAGFSVDKPGPVHLCNRADACLEGGRLLRSRSLPAAGSRDTLAARFVARWTANGQASPGIKRLTQPGRVCGPPWPTAAGD